MKAAPGEQLGHSELDQSSYHGARHRPRKHKPKQDASIMKTNDSSIVSKRSVAKLYHPDEPNFYEPFVKKFQRRNPLINRGYWLRMQAIEVTVRRFLEQDNGKHKIVVNLGCGYDPLPFQFLYRHPALGRHATFVDVDYPQLMEKKSEHILTSALLQEYYPAAHQQESENSCLVNNNSYVTIGCDLRDIEGLEKALRREFDLEKQAILFVAEVSITYMDVEAANSLIKWAASLNDAQFCLLEQHLPNGRENHFARTMMSHFASLQTPLQSVSVYPQLINQRQRFKDANWQSVHTQSLWELWADPQYVTAEERQQLDIVEPFDEWEEFALFGSHYFLLLASNTEESTASTNVALETNGISHWDRDLDWTCTDMKEKSWNVGLHKLSMSESTNSQTTSRTKRRFGATFRLGATVAAHGGLGQNTRVKSTVIFKQATSGENAITTVIEGPPTAHAYMCHCITALSEEEALMTGGRTSPSHASSNCWRFKQGIWNQAESLEPGRFRHCAIRISIRWQDREREGVLVFGGKTSFGNVLGDWQLWVAGFGWQAVPVSGPCPPARFGASLSTFQANPNTGYLTGGMTADGRIITDLWRWEIGAESGIRLTFEEWTDRIAPEACPSYPRFGASMLPFGSDMLLIGGVTQGRIPDERDEILVISPVGDVQRLHIEAPSDVRPLLIGFGATTTASGDIILVGGGAVCFSMGSFWNSDAFLISRKDTRMMGIWNLSIHQDWDQEQTLAHSTRNNGKLTSEQTNGFAPEKPTGPKVEYVRRLRITSEQEFTEILASLEPCVLEGLDLGSCVHRWTPEYLEEKIGADRSVVIHSCETDRMTFKTKNFSYLKKPFGEFIQGVCQGEKSYLRSVSTIQPGKHPTILERDFPGIAEDFHLPQALSPVKEAMHSSPLRVSGPLTLWLHYDVLANILCQIRGTKTLRLYPPCDATHLEFPPGGSSSNIDVFTHDHPSLALTHPHEALLSPGDVLFIPPMWSHTARPTAGMSVAVNVFFRNLEPRYYAVGRDVYGNRDLQAYESGRKDIERMVKAFDGMPTGIARFYLERLAAEMKSRAQELGSE